MAKFDIQYSQTIPNVTRMPRANLDVDTGAGDIARAVQGAGSAIQEVGERLDIMQAQTQLSEFKRTSEEEYNRMLIELGGNLDPDTYDAEYQKTLASIRSRMPKNAKAARGAELWLNTKSPDWESQIVGKKLYRAEDNFFAEGDMLAAQVIASGEEKDYQILVDYLAEGYNAGGIRQKPNESKIGGLILNVKAGMAKTKEKQNREIISQAIQSGAFTTTTGDVDQKMIQEAINGMTEDATERTELMRFAINEQNTIKAIEIQSKEQAQETFKRENYKLEISDNPADLQQEIKNYEAATDLFTVDEQRIETTYLSNVLAAKAGGSTNYNPDYLDASLTNIQAVKFAPDEERKAAYEEVRKWLMEKETIAGLGSEWDNQRKALDTAFNAKGDETTFHVIDAIKTVDSFFAEYQKTASKDIPLRDILAQKQAIRDEIQSKAPALTPKQTQDLTKELLAPIQSEEAKSMWDKFWSWEHPTWRVYSLTPTGGIVKSIDLFGRQIPAVKRRILENEPRDIEDFKSDFKKIDRVDPKLAEKYYDRWKGNFTEE